MAYLMSAGPETGGGSYDETNEQDPSSFKTKLGYGLAGIGGAGLLAGLLGQNDMPNAPETHLSQPTLDAMNRQFQHSMRSQDQIASDYMGGTEAGKSLMGVNLPTGGAGGSVNDASEQAIYHKANQNYAHQLDKLQNQVHLQSVQDKAAELSAAHNSFMMKAKIDIDNYKAKLLKYQAEQKARNDMLNSVLGLAGFGAGLAIAGPVGGAIGAGVGAGAGKVSQE